MSENDEVVISSWRIVIQKHRVWANIQNKTYMKNKKGEFRDVGAKLLKAIKIEQRGVELETGVRGKGKVHKFIFFCFSPSGLRRAEEAHVLCF